MVRAGARRPGLPRRNAAALEQIQENSIPVASFDCTQCPGYCCSLPRVAVSENDIRRLAKHFGIAYRAAVKRLTYRYQAQDVDERILRRQKDSVYKSICALFDTETRRCTVYEARPNVCRKYPYGNSCGYYKFLKFERDFHDEADFIPSA